MAAPSLKKSISKDISVESDTEQTPFKIDTSILPNFEMHFLDEKGAHYDNGMKKSMKGRVPKTIEQFE